MKLLRYADYNISFDFNFSQRQKHMYMYVFIKRTSRQLFIMHWLSRSGLQFAHTLNQCSHHGFPVLGQMILALGFIEVVTLLFVTHFALDRVNQSSAYAVSHHE